MTEKFDLDAWRNQWASIAERSPEASRNIQQRIRRQDRRFVLGNVLTALVFLGILLFAFLDRRQSAWMGTSWTVANCVLVCVSLACRIWVQRGTWRSETQTTHAFLELWQRRVQARLRSLRIAIYISCGWLVCCAALTVANWPTISPTVKANPWAWVGMLLVCVVMQPVIYSGARWLRRRKLAELDQINEALREMSD
jgi:Na+/melibiose symporter-like transporter